MTVRRLMEGRTVISCEGSSKLRTSIVKVSSNLISEKHLPFTKKSHAHFTSEKGFASYVDLSAIPNKLESCLAYAMEHVPTSHAPSTEVHVGGTAGLRLLRYVMYLETEK